MQPAHLLTDVPLVERHWGARGRGAYAFRTLLRRGSALVFGSDVPVASIDPREGVYAALERARRDGAPAGGWRPEEKLGLEDAVRAYTAAAARGGRRRAGAGRSRPGRMRTSWPGTSIPRSSAMTGMRSARGAPRSPSSAGRS